MSLKDEQAKIWADRGANIDAIRDYWHNAAHIKRCKWLGSKVIFDDDLESIFEVGIMGGRNIDVLKGVLRNQKIKFGGIDVGEVSVQHAKEHIPEGHFYQQSVYDMDVSEQYDLVFSMGVFIHIPPDGVDLAIQKCIQKAKRFVIHVEGVDDDIVSKGPESTSPKKIGTKFQWKPQLIRRYKKLGLSPEVSLLPPKYRGRDLTHLIKVNVEDFHNDR